MRGYHQINHTTQDDRYPEVFAYLGNIYQNYSNDVRILSYGCSYGNECFSIRKYFPQAMIYGFDISKKCIRVANKYNKDKRIFFTDSLENIKFKFDIVFAMSVLCRWIDTKDKEDCGNIYPYCEFNKSVELLDKFLQEEGFFVIYNANFRFTDTNSSKKYTPIIIDEKLESGFVTKFDSSNKVLPDQDYKYIVFKKIN